MTDAELIRRQGKTRRWWDHHGSWVLLAAVGIACFMAGSQYNAANTSTTVRILSESYERQDALRVKRIRELIDQNQILSRQLSTTVHTAVEKADQAASKANEAADKASEAVQKVQPVQ
ncbi:hypothetical protein EAW52_10805 [Pseudomonas sp. LTJR-52]|uniref:alanine-zipper protein n=1 Tax=Pseudomonas sp. LTJR-52 TaxID=2479392 RepID=UPI000EFD4DB8|nr:alanine-zipper protein [Pseudomonas sp. LTJR-52]AYN94413.1 hypothetical protein EAW52_10805 [Pseudomonas sp. LTJR-52]